jgi:uroporphyrinogen decarboxylase
MTSKERVLLAFERKQPDRVPVWCGASPEFIRKSMEYLGVSDEESVYKRFHDDFRRVYAVYAGPKEHAPDYNLPQGITMRSPFGIDRHGYGYGQPTTHPLADATLEEVNAYPWPDPAWMGVEHIKNDALKWKGEYAILGGDWSPFWHDAIDLMGMENLLVKMYEEPEIIEALLGHLVDYYYGVSERIFRVAADVIDIFFIGNDLGSQTGPIVGENLFRKFLLPHFERLAKLGHQYGLKVMLHCCGGFAPLIPCLVEAGIDALQSLQPDAYGMEPACLKQKYGDIIIFNGCVDSHNVLINGNPESVKEKTREILEVMMPGGGFILSPSHDYLLEETPVENVLAMYDTVMEYGNY